MAHLVTGYAGAEHIQSADDGAFNAAFFGDGQYIMESGNQFEGSILDNNTVRILDGDLLMYGRHIRIDPNTYEDLTIQTGTAGTYRNDLICMTYEKNASDGTEKAYLQVIKGTESESSAAIPAYTDGNILEAAVLNQMPLYKVSIAGVVLKEIIPMFKTIPTYKALAEKYEVEFKEACKTHLDSLSILDTLEEVEANTKANQIAGALALKEMHTKHAEDIASLNGNLANLGGFTPVIDETTGEITGYKTTIGGADTVFPFSGDFDFGNALTKNFGAYTDGEQIQNFTIAEDGEHAFIVLVSGGIEASYAKITHNGTTYSCTAIVCHNSYYEYGKLFKSPKIKVKKGDTLTITTQGYGGGAFRTIATLVPIYT